MAGTGALSVKEKKENATSASWRASDEDVARIIAATHHDPFSILGLHESPEGMVIRAFVPSIARLQARIEPDGPILDLERRGESDFFEALVPGKKDRFAYRLHAEEKGHSWDFLDPYAFGPALGPLDDYLLVEGTHQRLYQRLGAHPITHEGVDGVLFAVWAPQARRVSIVGDFNEWDGRRHTMRKRVDSGLWELFAPGLGEGTVYKYEIVGVGGNLMPLKADPFGFGSEMRPSTASIVARTDNFTWGDDAHLAWRSTADARRGPMSIYEVHLGSWRRKEGNGFLSYDELAEQLIPYATDMGFTHIELLPISEHPLDASWGYQPIGLFSPTRRFGDPAGFARFVDGAHRAGLSVILDWVPAHFPTDEHGLAWFDGAPLYEHPDPRRGFHPDWNTAIYDFGRREVASILTSNAMYWLDRFHVDGLRVDAVASMLYLDYSRRPGEWLPNSEGGNENRDAIRVPSIGRMNVVYAAIPALTMTAEESTAWPAVSRPTTLGWPGFDSKWNMGWMNDTLNYFQQESRYTALPPQQAHLRPALRVHRELRPSDLTRRSGSRQRLGSSTRCPATIGSNSRTPAPITASCGAIPARSFCSWARSSASGTNGTSTPPSTGGFSNTPTTAAFSRSSAT